MEHFEDHQRHDGRQRVDSALVWTATGGALVCSAVIFLATNWPSPDPVAEPLPSALWSPPATTSSTVDSDRPGYTFDVVAPPPQDAATVTSSPGSVTTTRANPPTQPVPLSPPGDAPAPPRPTGSPVHAVGAGKCLDVPNSTTTAGTQLQTSTCSGRANQAWTRTPSGQLTVTLGGTTQCLDAYGQRTQPGTAVVIHPCNGQGNEVWRFNRDGTVIGVQSGLCLDVTGASVDNGAPVELWSCNGQDNQRWTFG
ncbi:RICIN domain-containing protein [Kutzneria chonburiensis]|uniref:Ricin-type beta-trefoil lectin domain protein n=1 Tax=Kutzneria chonburiensis TaxID=1483604 RepID=A0ABV6MP18_9PSEU|nr:ricin-type beta-trefoil lectin domain protein [Kutzneria chonburiensis]